MNERIADVIIEAMDAIPEHMEFNIPKEFMEKFAELIVRECAKIANSQFEAATGLNDRDSWTAAEMKKHFGVQE
jgi:hypothetical protein